MVKNVMLVNETVFNIIVPYTNTVSLNRLHLCHLNKWDCFRCGTGHTLCKCTVHKEIQGGHKLVELFCN